MEELQPHLNSDYKYGFVSDVEAEEFPIGLNEDIIRELGRSQERTRVDARVPPQGVPALADDEGAELGRISTTSRSTMTRSSTIRRPRRR